MMRIITHKLDSDSAVFKAAQACGGRLVTPSAIVVHDTADIRPGGAVDWFTSDDCNTSAHIVVERDGSVTQLVKFDTIAFHAGKSELHGRSGCNAFTIGIEIVNPGKIGLDGRAWFHKPGQKGFDVSTLKRIKTKEHGDGYWMEYTPEQVRAVTEICQALVRAYPSIREITAHYLISPGRKIDVNPTFPLDQLRRDAFANEPEKTPPLALVQAEAIPQPSMVKEAAQSRSIWAAVSGIASVVLGALTDYAKQGWDWLMWAVDIVPKVKQEVDEVVAPIQEMAVWFGANLSKIALTMSAVCAAVFLWRHLQLKMQVAATSTGKDAQ